MPFPEFPSIQLLFSFCLSHELSVTFEIIDLLTILLLLSLGEKYHLAILFLWLWVRGMKNIRGGFYFLGKADASGISSWFTSSRPLSKNRQIPRVIKEELTWAIRNSKTLLKMGNICNNFTFSQSFIHQLIGDQLLLRVFFFNWCIIYFRVMWLTKFIFRFLLLHTSTVIQSLDMAKAENI